MFAYSSHPISLHSFVVVHIMAPSLRSITNRSISPSASPHTVRISLAKSNEPTSITHRMDPSTSSSSLEEIPKDTKIVDADVESTNTSTETTPPSDPIDHVELADLGLEEEDEDDEDDELKELEQMSRPTRRRVDVISSTMNPMVEQLVADAAVIAVNKFDVEKEYCRYIKQYLDMQIGPYFHCICGRKFGAYVSASSSWSFCFRIEQYTFLVFRSNDLPLISRTGSESSESRSSSSRKSFS